MDEHRPEIRIGDLQRAAVDAHLRQALDDGVLTLAEYDERAAQCWSARTSSELSVITADLPAFRGSSAPAPARRGSARTRTAVGVAVAVLIGGIGFAGVQAFASADAVSVFGSSIVTLAPGQSRVDVTMVFGSMVVVVPDDVRVTRTGAVLFGSINCETACQASGPEVTVDVTGAFGSVAIETAAENARD